MGYCYIKQACNELDKSKVLNITLSDNNGRNIKIWLDTETMFLDGERYGI